MQSDKKGVVMLIINRWLSALWVFQVLIRPVLPFAIIPPLSTTGMSSHERILDQQSRHTSAEFLKIRATVDAAVKAENEDLLYLACVMKRASAMSNSQEAKMIVRKEILQAAGRWTQENSAFSRLGEIQNFLEVGYQQYDQTLIVDSKHTQLDSTRKTLLRAQPFSLLWIGYDFKKMYWEPWVQSRQQIKDLDAPVSALNRESQTRAMIHETRLALQRDFTDLTLSLSSKEIETTQDGNRDLVRRVYNGFWRIYYKCRSQEAPARVALKEWYWQHVARHPVRFQTPSARSDFDLAWEQLDCEVTRHEEL